MNFINTNLLLTGHGFVLPLPPPNLTVDLLLSTSKNVRTTTVPALLGLLGSSVGVMSKRISNEKSTVRDKLKKAHQ